MSPALLDKTVLVTRPKNQADDLSAKIQALGARPLCLAAISVAPPQDWSPVDRTIRSLASYDWIVFTSANGVDSYAKRMIEAGVAPTALSDRKLAAIGPATAAALARVAREPDVVPDEFISDAIADTLGDVQGLRVLLPRADIARQELALELAARGADVDAVPAYSVVGASDPADVTLIDRELDGTAPDYITLTSPSAARSLYALLQSAGRERWMKESELICIGPVTADALADLDLVPAAVAAEHTTDGLVDALKARAEQNA